MAVAFPVETSLFMQDLSDSKSPVIVKKADSTRKSETAIDSGQTLSAPLCFWHWGGGGAFY